MLNRVSVAILMANPSQIEYDLYFHLSEVSARRNEDYEKISAGVYNGQYGKRISSKHGLTAGHGASYSG